jgi:hypothetical protein
MAIAFPANPQANDLHTVGSFTYKYDGDKWIGVGLTPIDRLTEGSNSLEITAGNDLVWTGDALLIGVNSTSNALASAIIQGNPSNNTSNLALASNTSTPADGEQLGNLAFGDSGHLQSAYIGAHRDGGTWTSGISQPTKLVFNTTPDGSADVGGLRRMTITSDGVVDIDKASAPGLVVGGNGGSGDYHLELGQIGTNGSGGINATGTSTSLKFQLNGSDIARFDNAGRLLIGNTTNTITEAKIEAYADNAGNNDVLCLYNKNTATGNTANILFAPSNTVAGARIICEAMEDFSTSANRTSDLAFVTRRDGTLTERLRITSDGQFQVDGTSSSLYLKTEYRGSVSVTNANTDSFAFRLRGSGLGSGGRLYMSGTSGNVVVNVVADIMISHSGHVAVQSMSNGYTQGRIRIVTDADENGDVFIGRTNGFATGTTNLAWRFIPFGNSYIQTSSGNYSTTSHLHATSANSYRISATSGGNVNASGTKNFLIDHPLESLGETTRLVHAAVEGPECNTIYRGKVDLVDGTSTVNIDTNSRMTEGTFVALNQNVQCFTTNETGWTAIKSSVSGNLLTITAQDNTCTDTVSWMVVGERKDQDIINSNLTDSEGRLIPEITDEFDPSQYPEYVAPEEPAE